EVRRHADVVQALKQIFGNAVVEDALALDHLMLFGIEGGRVVLEVLNQSARLRALIEDLRLAFIDAATAAHRSVPWFVKIHRGAVAPVCDRSAAASGRHNAEESNALPFTTKTYP